MQLVYLREKKDKTWLLFTLSTALRPDTSYSSSVHGMSDSVHTKCTTVHLHIWAVAILCIKLGFSIQIFHLWLMGSSAQLKLHMFLK